jgi:Gpi18-like mannosyltransferase
MKLRKIAYLDFCLILLGLSIRVVVAPFTEAPFDMKTWMSVGSSILSGQNPYSVPFNALVYPPLWGLFCAISCALYNIWGNPFVFNLVIKLPIIAADVLISVVARRLTLALTQDARKARIAMILYLLNPVTIVVSAFWGMFDAIPTLFALLSLLYLSESKYLKSGTALGLGIGFKGFFPFFLLPFFAYCVLRREGKVFKSIKYIGYSLLIPVLISLPFMASSPNSYFSSVFIHVNRAPQNLTYWVSVGYLLTLIEIPLNIVTLITSSFFAVCFPILYFLTTKKFPACPSETRHDQVNFMLKLTIILFLIFYCTSGIVNEQYLIWATPFLILYLLNFDESFKLLFYALWGLDLIFAATNLGPTFFTPMIETPIWWTNFRWSQPVEIALAVIGILFSVTCAAILKKFSAPAESSLTEQSEK